MPAPSRKLIELTSAESARLISETSILCLPLGSIEQHGPHLPLNTDVVIAEGLTREIVAHWGEEFDLWQLPAVPVGLAREHDWAAGTLSLSITGFFAHLRQLAGTRGRHRRCRRGLGRARCRDHQKPGRGGACRAGALARERPSSGL